MRRLISQFVDLPRPVQIALMAMGGVGILGIVLAIARDRQGLNWPLLGIIAIGICVVVVMLLAYRALRKHLKKRKANPFEREIKASSSAVPQGVSDVADRAHLDGMRKRFEDGIAKFRDRGKDLYTVPWYVFIGESGSGKTEAIRHCGIKFPPGLQDELQGTGGTINMDWWFTDHGVILDTAGRIVFGDVESVDTKEWHEFLGLLQKHRKHCPINGLLLAIPIDSLIQDDATEIEQKAGKIARELDQLQRMLGVRFPVYVLVTKSDKLTGFRQFFSEFRDPQAQAQMLGWSNAAQLDDPFDPSSIKNSVDQIRERLDRKRLALLQDPVNTEDQSARRTDQVDELYAFPESVQRIASRLQRYLELIFTTGIWSSKPLFLRGIYFTSSMQHGQALDLELADALNVPIESLQEAAWTEDKAYFLRDVFQEKIFKEWGLVTGHTNIRRVQRRRRIVLLGSGFAAAIIIAALTIWNWIDYSSSIGDHVTFWENAAGTFADDNSHNLPIVDFVGDGFFYKGGSAILAHSDYWTEQRLREEASPEERLSKDSSHLVKILVLAEDRQRYDISTPWTFWPVAWFQRETGFFKSKRQDTFRHLFDEAVLRPLLVHARNQFARMEMGQNDIWSEVETNALAHLIEVQEQGTISKRFIDDQLRFLLGDAADAANDAPKLQGILDRLYGGSEDGDQVALPSGHPLRAGHTSAINDAIAKLEDYWAGPDKLEKYRKLLAAVQVFEEAEQRLLLLASSSSVSKSEWEGRYRAPPAVLGSEQTIGLKDAYDALTDAIAECGLNATSGDEATDVITLKQALLALSREAQETIDVLLVAATGNSEAGIDNPPLNADGVAARLVSVWEKFTRDQAISLQSTDTQITDADKYHLGPVLDPSRIEYKRLYELRSAMYRTAHGLYDTQQRATDLAFGDTAERFQQISSDIDAAGRELASLMDQVPAALSEEDDLHKRFKKAEGLCESITIDTAKVYLQDIVAEDFETKIQDLRTGLEIANEVEQLYQAADRKEKEEYELPEIPLTNLKLNPKYYPPAALGLLADWKAMTAAVEEFEDRTVREYTLDYFEYWSDGVFAGLRLNAKSWEELQDQLEGYEERHITGPLLRLAELVEARLGELKGEINEVAGDILSEIESRTEKVSAARGLEAGYHDRFGMILTNWRSLAGAALEARRVLLDVKSKDDFINYYSVRVAVQTELKAEEFVERFWRQFSIDALRLLVDGVKADSGEVVKNLEQLRRFPLAPYSEGERQLTHLEVIRAKSLVGEILAQEIETSTFDTNSRTGNADEIARLREDLRSPLGTTGANRFKKWQKLLNGLPGEDKKYKADLYVIPAEPPSSPEWKRVSDFWNYMDCVTNPSDPKDAKNIVNRESKALREGHEYPGDVGLYPRFYTRQEAGAPVDRLELVGKEDNQPLVFKGPWAILHLLYACEGELLESVDKGWEQAWRAELIIQREGDNQQYSIWLEVRFKDAVLPALEDWPNEEPVPADNAP